MICGCSFSAVSTEDKYAGTSWSEILIKKLGPEWKLVNVARQGVSNGGIRLQIEEALRLNPTFTIVTPTSQARIEIPAIPLEQIEPESKNTLSNALQVFWHKIANLVDERRPIGYDRGYGLKNINYNDNQHYNLISETIFTLTLPERHAYRKTPLPPEIRQAVKDYILYLYDAKWKTQQDEWIIRDGITQMEKANMPFLVNIGLLSDYEYYLKNLPDMYKLIGDEIKYNPVCVGGSHTFVNEDPGYHTSLEGQQFIAEKYYDIIKNRWNL